MSSLARLFLSSSLFGTSFVRRLWRGITDNNKINRFQHNLNKKTRIICCCCCIFVVSYAGWCWVCAPPATTYRWCVVVVLLLLYEGAAAHLLLFPRSNHHHFISFLIPRIRAKRRERSIWLRRTDQGDTHSILFFFKIFRMNRVLEGKATFYSWRSCWIQLPHFPLRGANIFYDHNKKKKKKKLNL